MKKYVKPQCEITLFSLNETIASCPTTNTYNPVQVNCLITNHHHIFYTSCENFECEQDDCDGGINYNAAVRIEYNDTEYLLWGDGVSAATTYAYNDNNNENDTNTSGMSTISAIVQQGISNGILDSSSTAIGTHAGEIIPDIDAVRNASV